MDEARRIVERLRRIDALCAERAGERAVLAEVDRLVNEARAWLEVERGGTGAAVSAAAEGSGAAGETRKAMIPM